MSPLLSPLSPGRALAFYERAGGQPPASSGVCGSLSLSAQQLEQSVTLLSAGDPGSPGVGLGTVGRGASQFSFIRGQDCGPYDQPDANSVDRPLKGKGIAEVPEEGWQRCQEPYSRFCGRLQGLEALND